MPFIGNPMQIPELDLRPVPEGGIQLSEDMQQVLSSLTGFWHNKRILIKSTPDGMLYVGSPQVKDMFHVTALGANETYQGGDILCSTIMVMGHPSNTGNIWVKIGETATVNNAWPLANGDVVGLGITNLQMLNLLIVTSGEKAIVLYA